MLPSRSTKTAVDSVSFIFAVLSETGDKLIACHGRCSKLADHNSASVVGDFRLFNRSRSADESKGKERNGSVAGAVDVENLPCVGWDVMRRFILMRKHNTEFAERDDDICCYLY